MRYKSSTKLLTGSSPSKKPPEIKHLELLRNYDTVTARRRTMSTLYSDDDEYAETRRKQCVPPKKRGKVNDEFLSVA